LTTIFAPSLANLSAIARPIPRPDPVITATLPSSFPFDHVLILPPIRMSRRAMLPKASLQRNDRLFPSSRHPFLGLRLELDTRALSPATSSISATRSRAGDHFMQLRHGYEADSEAANAIQWNPSR